MIKASNSRFGIKGGGTFTILDHYVYFKEVTPGPDGQRVLPVQSSGNQIVFAPEVSASMRFFRHMYFRPQAIYSHMIRNDDQAIRLPELFVNAQLSYENILFKGRLQLNLGADMFWRSTYKALAYDTPTQSFYVQDRQETKAFPVVDLFAVCKMGRVRFFFKYNNLIQSFTGTGYQITPNYPGQRSVFDLGFEFMLFD